MVDTVNSNYLQETLDSNEDVLAIIYIITNSKNNKKYTGQTVTHKLNTNKYRPFGEVKRLKQHCSDAICNTKKNQCTYLNNAIRKYGTDSFTVEVLEYCSQDDANDREIFHIREHNTMFPVGYNLTEGGKKGPTLQPQKEKLMRKSHEQFAERKLERFKDVKIDCENLQKYIHERHHGRYGGTYYTVIIGGKNSIFVGKYITKEELKQKALEFVQELARRFAT